MQPCSQAIGETAWQLPRVQTVYGCDITVIAIIHSNCLVHVILNNFSSCDNGAFLLVEATICCRFYYWSEIEVTRTKIVVQSAYTSAICTITIEVEWVWLRRFNALCNWVLLLSCDYILKYNWYCQLSGSGSNRLNSRKLPGRFSYGLGTRLDYTQENISRAIYSGDNN